MIMLAGDAGIKPAPNGLESLVLSLHQSPMLMAIRMGLEPILPGRQPSVIPIYQRTVVWTDDKSVQNKCQYRVVIISYVRLQSSPIKARPEDTFVIRMRLVHVSLPTSLRLQTFEHLRASR